MIGDQDVERPTRGGRGGHDAVRGRGLREVRVDEDDLPIDGAQLPQHGIASRRRADWPRVIVGKALNRDPRALRGEEMRRRKANALAPAHARDQRGPAVERASRVNHLPSVAMSEKVRSSGRTPAAG